MSPSTPVRIVDSEILTFTLADGTILNITIGGVIPQLDDTDKIATSTYGKNESAGDTAIRVNAAGEFTASASGELLLEKLLVEAKIRNLYLSRVVGEVFTEMDIEDD